MIGLTKTIILSLVVIALILAGCSPIFEPQVGEGAPPPSPTTGLSTRGSVRSPVGGLSRSNKQGTVTVDAKLWMEDDGSFVFDISLDTHSGDLDGYDLKELAMLRDDAGNEYRPTSWGAPAGGHHRSGKLTFGSLPTAVAASTKYVELVVRNVAGIQERVLKWDLS